MKRLLILFVVLSGILVIAPVIIGDQVETHYGQLHAQLENNPSVTITGSSYERGWFGALAKTDLTLQLPVRTAQGEVSTERFDLQLVSQITHGPLLPGGGGLAEIDTSFQGVEVLFPADYVADIRTQFNFSGTAVSAVTLPPAELQGGKDWPPITFGGIKGDVAFEVDLSAVRSQFTMPQLVANKADGSKLVVGQIKLRTETKKSATGLTTGKGYLEVDKFHIEAPQAGFRLALADLQFEASSEEEAGSVATNVIYRFDDLEVSDDRYGPAEFKLELSQLPSDALLKMQQGLEAVNAQTLDEAQRGMAVMSVLMGHAPALLTKDPKLAIKKLYIMTPDGEVSGDLTLQAVDLKWVELANPSTMIEKLVGEASLQLPETLLLKLIEQQAKQQYLAIQQQRRLRGEVTDADASKPTPDFESQSKEILDLWIRQQFAVREGAQVSSLAVLSKGLLTVNGKTIPLMGQ